MWKKVVIVPVLVIGGAVRKLAVMPWHFLFHRGCGKSTWSSVKSTATRLKVCNKCPFTIDIFWVDYEGLLQPFEVVKPGRTHAIST